MNLKALVIMIFVIFTIAIFGISFNNGTRCQPQDNPETYRSFCQTEQCLEREQAFLVKTHQYPTRAQDVQSIYGHRLTEKDPPHVQLLPSCVRLEELDASKRSH